MLMEMLKNTMGKQQAATWSSSANVARWHADIKPDNILSVQGRFKVADPGFAKFVPKIEGQVAEEFVLGGTETYGDVTQYL